MATAGPQEGVCRLIEDGTLELEAGRDSWYSGIVVAGDVVMMADYASSNVQLHRRQDGRLLAIHELESLPQSICVINDMEICVSLFGGQIVILSVQCNDDAYTITRVRTLLVPEGLDLYHGVSKFKDNVVVCGVKHGTICWCIVSLNDGHVVDTIHQTCKGDYIYIATKDNMIYISCNSGSVHSPDNGVYGYDIQNHSKQKYIYKHKDLYCPTAITVDSKGFLFVCNYGDPKSAHPYPCIHHLTDKCELVSIYRQGIPHCVEALFWDQHQGHLYVASLNSNVITIYRHEYQDPVIPAAVLKMDTRSLHMYMEALRAGKEKVYNIRVMVVGQYDVGKTTLTKRLLGKYVNISDKKSTEGIDVHIECCKVSLATGEWTTQEKNAEQYFRLQRLVKILNEHVQKQEASDEQGGQSRMDDHSANKECENEHHAKTSISHTIDQPVQDKTSIKKSNLLPSSQQIRPSIVKMDKSRVDHTDQKTSNISTPSGDIMSDKSDKNDAVIEILQLVNKNPDKLEKNIDEYAALAIWDFAGQYAFYTTHQTFLTSRAIYLLVIDLNQQLTDLIKDDECFLDTEGIKQYKVYDLMEIWLNSIHSCAPSTDSGIPPVILVGTHMDKIPEKSRQQVIDEYFRKIRYMLSDKPTILHLVDDIAIDNTQCDPNLRLEELKKRIFELAKQQPHWGEERPARWLPLEQAIMTLKASSVKIAPLSLVEEINRSGSVRIDDSKELDLFLRFQHEIGTILYFSVEGLREKIMLDPQWIIDALKSLITAEAFIKQNPAITRKWYEFKEKGILTHELLDVIWSKEKSPEFHDNKDYILLLMEKLNIVARPKSYSQDGKEVKVENYFLAPCMLSVAAPREIISPEAQPDMESSSVLSFVFVEKFLPSPIFHRLLAASVAHWPIAKKNSENLIYCGCCIFDLDLHHRLTVFFREHVIFVRVTRMGITEKTPSSKLCIEVREFITVTLTNVIGFLGQSLRFDLFIRCPKSDGYGVNCLIPVADLKGNLDVPCHFHDKSHMIMSCEMLKFWFQEEKQLNIGGTAGQKQYKMPQTKKGHSTTKSKPILSTKQTGVTAIQLSKQINSKTKVQAASPVDKKGATTIQPSIQMPSKQINPKTKKQADSAADKKVFSLPHNLQDKKPSERQLGRLSMRIGPESFRLGLELGLSGVDIQIIQKDYPHTVTQCLRILVKWKQQSGEKATFGNLEKAFKNVGIDVGIFKSIDTAGDMVSCFPPKMQDKQPDDKHLNRISSRIGTGHVHLGVELEVPLSRIDRILTDHPGDMQRQCFEIMKVWRQRHARQATLRTLEQAFRCVGIDLDILKQSVN